MEKDELIKKITDIIKGYLKENYKIFLFGSFAKNKALTTSDIDIGILGETKVPWSTMVKIKEEIDKIPTLRSIDLVDLNAVSENFKNNVLRNAKVLS